MAIRYVWGLIPWALITFTLYFIFPSHYYDKALLSVAYFWHFALSFPSSYWQDRLDDKRYRFSFIRLILLAHRFLSRQIPGPDYLVRSISPTLFNVLCLTFTDQGLLPFLFGLLHSLGGSLAFELSDFLRRKVQPLHE